MGGNYEKSIYNQLMEVMGRLDAVEKDLCHEKAEHKSDVERLNARISDLTAENQLLRKASLTITAQTLQIRLLLTRKQADRPILITAGKRPAAAQAGRKGAGAPPLPKRMWKKNSVQGNAATRSVRSVTRPDACM